MNQNTKKLILGLILVLGLTLILTGCQPTKEPVKEEQKLKVGAIIPLTGPAGVLGKGVKKGIEQARKDLSEKDINIEVVYEDSQANPSKGLSAYQKLTTIENVDVIISMFSRVSIPLISRANEDNTPLIMTLVKAKDAPSRSPYAFRVDTNPRIHAETLFDGILKEGDNIAILHLNDEFGTSVKKGIEELAPKNNVNIEITEAFEPSATDVRTQLTKIKASNADKLVIVPSVPQEAITLVKQAKELGIEIPIVDSISLLAIEGVRNKLAKKTDLEGDYTLAFKPHLNPEQDEMAEVYIGYDLLNLLGKATQGKKLSSKEIKEKLRNYGTYKGKMGKMQVQDNGEINPPVHAAKIIDGELQTIE